MVFSFIGIGALAPTDGPHIAAGMAAHTQEYRDHSLQNCRIGRWLL
jgi:hypothetical protein